MLPFTKRPGRDESGDQDVVTKDDLVVPATAAPASKGSARAKFPSLNDEEMTTLMKAKSIGDAIRSAVRPAAGAPPPSSDKHAGGVPSSRPSAPASRSGKFAAQDEDEDGRTVVRGAPKIVKRGAASSPAAAGSTNANAARAKLGGMNTLPTTISPAAVIKATLESARAGVKPRTGDHLMAGPPQDLLEDLADRHPSDVGSEHTAILKSPSVPPPGMIQGVKALSTQMLQPQALPHGSIPPGSSRPLTNPPPPNSQPGSHPFDTTGGSYTGASGNYAGQSGGYAAQSGGYAAQSGGYSAQGPVPSGSVSVPGVSMPAHFMVPQPPYSDGRIDPPGTAVTARMKIGGRPAMSWAMALAAFGLFVGVGAVAVMNGNSDGVMETGASFVDPSRAGGKATAAQAAAAAQAAGPTAAAPTGVPVGNEAPATVGVPPVAIPAAPVAVAAAGAAPAAGAVATAPVVAAAPAATAPVVAAPVAAAPVAAARTANPVAAAPARPAPVAAAPVARPARPAPAAAAAEEPAAAAPAKATKGGKPAKGGGEVDDETKKALDELQKAQLERSF